MKTLVLFLFFANIMLSPAIIYRHDKDSTDYLKLAQEEQFKCVGHNFRIIKKNNTDSLLGKASCVLISDRYILSACHLFTDVITKDTTAYINDTTKIYYNILVSENQAPCNEYRFQFENKLYEPDTIIFHPGYFGANPKGKSKNYDICLIKLKEPVSNIKIPQLNNKYDEVGKKAVGVGWGHYGGAYDDSLKLGKKLAGENMIDSILNFRDGVPGYMVCDFDSPTDTNCNKTGNPQPLELEFFISGGDSGGGLLIEKNNQWLLAGVSPSGGIYLDQFMKTGYYCHKYYWVRISTILDWINKTIKETK